MAGQTISLNNIFCYLRHPQTPCSLSSQVPFITFQSHSQTSKWSTSAKTALGYAPDRNDDVLCKQATAHLQLCWGTAAPGLLYSAYTQRCHLCLPKWLVRPPAAGEPVSLNQISVVVCGIQRPPALFLLLPSHDTADYNCYTPPSLIVF
jgi:hypothetical protein